MIYLVTNREGFKSDYRFVQQIRAATGSIMDNIAEGFERTGNKEFLNFLFISKGSCSELRSQLIRANDVGFITTEEFEELYAESRKLSAGISKMVFSIEAATLLLKPLKHFKLLKPLKHFRQCQYLKTKCC